jgi:hypothetical protein
MPHGQEGPYVPNVQTEPIIIGIFPFLDAYIAIYLLIRLSGTFRGVRQKGGPNRTEPAHH